MDAHGKTQDTQKLNRTLMNIRHKVIVLSGKGGVGKSTVAVNLAVSLAQELAQKGKYVGLLDVDLHGPSVPTMMGIEGAQLSAQEGVIYPAEIGNLKVMSVGFMLRERDDAVIWRGPLKMTVIRQFLEDVAWGDLEYLIIDSPPGTGDEPLSVCQLISDADGAVIVTAPQRVATTDVRKSISFCRKLELPVLGVVENMSGFACPECGTVTEIFRTGGGELMAQEMQVPFLGKIPLDPQVAMACDDGTPHTSRYADSETAKAFRSVLTPILALSREKNTASSAETAEDSSSSTASNTVVTRFALPLAEGKLAMHFGHCREFALIDVDRNSGFILGRTVVPAPEHQPGLLPRWLAEKRVHIIIAGGMGTRAQDLFRENGIDVVTGAYADAPEALVEAYLNGTLSVGENVCDH